MVANRTDPLIQDAVADIIWAAKARPGFDLFFVVGNTPEIRNQFRESIQEQAPGSIVIDLSGQDEGLFSLLQNLPKAQGPTLISGLEERLGTNSATRDGFVGQMNLDRDAIRRLERNLIFLLPIYALTEFARQAPDFYDFRTALLELPEPSTEGSFERGGRGPLWATNPAERDRWIALEESRANTTDSAMSEIDRMVQLGQLYREKGEPNRAEALLQDAYKQAKKSRFGADLVSLLLNELGLTLLDLGRVEEALEFLREADRITRMALGNDHPLLSISVSNIGGVLEAMGDLEGALKCYEEAERIDRTALGADDPEIATDLNNIGGILAKQGHLRGALRQFREAERINRTAFGDNHPQVAINVSNVGGVLLAYGDLKAALRAFREAERIDRACYGNDHPQVANDLMNVAGVRHTMGDSDGAIRIIQEALPIFLRAYGATGRRTVLAARNLESLGGTPLVVARETGGEEIAEGLASALSMS